MDLLRPPILHAGSPTEPGFGFEGDLSPPALRFFVVGHVSRLAAVVVITTLMVVPIGALLPTAYGTPSGVRSETSPTIPPPAPVAQGAEPPTASTVPSSTPAALASPVCLPRTAITDGGGGIGPTGSVGGAPLASGEGSNDTAATAISTVVATVERHGACPATVFPPRPPASPAQLADAEQLGVVTPLYTGTPAPMGLAYYGLSTGPGASLAATVLNTTSLRGQVVANATGIRPLDLYNAEVGPDAYSIQLNAVLTHVALFGRSRYSFWAQDVFEYYPSADRVSLITNVWNFSGSYFFGPGAIYAHGPDGQLYAGEVYEAIVNYTEVRYPFDLSLYLNSTVTDGRDAVDFAADLSGPGESIVAPFDYVVFNSTTARSGPVSGPAPFSANGTGYDPAGLTNDFELDLGGPGGGSQATLFAADAELGLAYWDPGARHGAGGYRSVPAAFSYGGETGETSTGASVAWSDAPGGPGGLGTYATMTTGASFASGLWNLSGPEGSYPITVEANPSNAFEILTPASNQPWRPLGGDLVTSPSPRSSVMEAFDPMLHATILYGGYSPSVGRGLADTWEFADDRWTNITTVADPPARWGGALVYDPVVQQLVLFGGRYGSTGAYVYNDTWEFNATGWHPLNLTVHPSGRGYAAAAFDPAIGKIVLFGGGVGNGNSYWQVFGDTWTFSGTAWTNVTATAGAPPASIKASMAYDPQDGGVLMAGGASTGNYGVPCPYDRPQLWTFVGGSWSAMTPSGAAPPAGAGSLWYDAGTNTTYYYEGLENLSRGNDSACEDFVGDLYAYSSGSWSQLEASASALTPPPRILAGVVDDPADHEELLFGGQQSENGPFFGDTWAYSPNATFQPAGPVLAMPTVAPMVTTDTLWLAPGNYSLVTELSGYDPTVTPVNVTGPMTLTPSLVADPSTGVYTPLWAWANGQLAAISTSGDGSPSRPYVLENDQNVALGPAFGILNDYSFPTYPGLFLLDVSASVDVDEPPSFAAELSRADGGSGVSGDDGLQLWFWNVTGVALTNASDLGASEALTSPFAPFAAIFYDAHGNLIDGDRFTGSYGNLLLEGGPTDGPFVGPAGDNTIWGNRFAPLRPDELGLAEVEGGDLIYNNDFGPAYTACSPGDPSLPNYCWPIYAFAPVNFSDRWNISVMPASVVHYASGFPNDPLNGSVAGTGWQGGNLWWDYGLYPNAYGRLPYVENVSAISPERFIDPGGDDAPLHLDALYRVTFEESGLRAGLTWEVVLWNNSLGGVLDQAKASAPAAIHALLPNASVTLEVWGPLGWVVSSGPSQVTVAGSNFTVTFDFEFARIPLVLIESGLSSRTLSAHGWGVVLNGTSYHSTTRTINVTATRLGALPYLILAPAEFVPSYEPRTLNVTFGMVPTVAVSFERGRSASLAISERGVPVGTSWCVALLGDEQCATRGTVHYRGISRGNYSLEVVRPIVGQSISARVGSHPANVSANGSSATVYLGFNRSRSLSVHLTFSYPLLVFFVEQGLPNGTVWGGVVKRERLQNVAPYDLVFQLANGTYRFRVFAVPGYHLVSTPRRFTVDGTWETVRITFAPTA